MMSQKRGRGSFELVYAEMASMVDSIMVLVIFLMLGRAFINDRGIEAQKPDISGAPSGDQKMLLIAISPENRSSLDDQEFRTDQDGGVVKQAAIGRSPGNAMTPIG